MDDTRSGSMKTATMTTSTASVIVKSTSAEIPSMTCKFNKTLAKPPLRIRRAINDVPLICQSRRSIRANSTCPKPNHYRVLAAKHHQARVTSPLRTSRSATLKILNSVETSKAIIRRPLCVESTQALLRSPP